MVNTNAETVKSFLNSMQTEGAEAARRKFCTPEFKFVSEGAGEMQDGLNDLMRIIGENLDADGMRMDIHSITSQEDRVSMEAESFATLKSGVKYNNRYHFMFVLKDGRINLMHEYHDTAHAKDVWGKILAEVLDKKS